MRSRETARLMTRCWICSVPSKCPWSPEGVWRSHPSPCYLARQVEGVIDEAYGALRGLLERLVGVLGALLCRGLASQAQLVRSDRALFRSTLGSH